MANPDVGTLKRSASQRSAFVCSHWWVAMAMLALFSASLRADPPKLDTPKRPTPVPIAQAFCGKLGFQCCRPPAGSSAAAQPNLVTCDAGLGCDVDTNRCVQPCGGDGQACCDGPTTVAPRWTIEGFVESPNSPLLTPMCNTGGCASATHRCESCGMTEGTPCCAPDASRSSAFCANSQLECTVSDSGLSGTCIVCGGDGQVQCRSGCKNGFSPQEGGVCKPCGSALHQRSCDGLCDPPLNVLGGVCERVGAQGQDPGDGGKCNLGLHPVGGVCQKCGSDKQSLCDGFGCMSPAKPAQGLCLNSCGEYDGSTACDKGPNKGCAGVLKNEGGVCIRCGASGEHPCADSGCDNGAHTVNGFCEPGCSHVGHYVCDDNAGCYDGEVDEHGFCVQFLPPKPFH